MDKAHHSLTKLIIILILLCFLIMGSVLVYHSYHKQNPTRLAHDKALVFATGRELKPFTLVTTENKKFSERDLVNHWTLLFFGFSHCMSICPTTLSMLKEAYPALHKQIPNLQVVFISLDPERDTPAIANRYAKRFHPDFLGVTGNLTEIRKFQGQLGIASARDSETVSNNYQIIHTSSIMLINPQLQWVAMFKYGMNANEFSQAMTESMKLL